MSERERERQKVWFKAFNEYLDRELNPLKAAMLADKALAEFDEPQPEKEHPCYPDRVNN